MRTANPSSSSMMSGKNVSVRPPQAGEGGVQTLGPIVEWLVNLGVTDHWVVSCYLKLEPRDRSRGKYLIKLKNRMRDELAWFEQRGVIRPERDVVAKDLTRVREYLENPGNLGPGQGIAIFACEPLGLFEAISLPRVFRSRLQIDRSPLVRELAAVDDEFGRVLCVVHDRTSARFFEVTAIGIDELSGLAPGDTTRPGRFRGQRAATGTGAGAGSAGEHNFHQRIREEKHRHYASIAQRLFEISRDRPARGVVLAGVGADSEAVTPHLHPYLASQMLGTAQLNPKSATAADVRAAVLQVRADSERAVEARAVGELREGLGTGWAVNGIDEVLTALQHGQVRTLLVEPSAEAPGYRCDQSGRLTLKRTDCEGHGGAVPVPDLIDEAIEEALRQGSTVELVEDGVAREAVAGLAALLRFKR